MKAIVYPADAAGCGHNRIIWPAQALAAAGHDITIAPPVQQSGIPIKMRDDTVIAVDLPEGTDLVVFQRTTHPWMVDAIRVLRTQGVAVVLDVDDDLAAIHPSNAAFHAMRPGGGVSRRDRRAAGTRPVPGGHGTPHSWGHLATAARAATYVTVSADALLPLYAPHGRGRVLPNCVPARYLTIERSDSPNLGWGGAVGTHPDDLQQVQWAVARVVQEGGWFTSIGDPAGVVEALRLDPTRYGPAGVVSQLDWPFALARVGVGIAPLAPTRFNASKSYLKPLEYAGLGVPWVGSPLPEYRRLHSYGCGRLATKPADWYRELSALCGSAAARQDASAAGRQVAAGHTYEGRAWMWWEAWTEALRVQRGASVGV